MSTILRGPYSYTSVRRAAQVALFFQWFIVLSGSTVRLTGSGLGCPRWPTCSDTSSVPELSFHPMVEFLNRMTATPTLLTALISMWMCWHVVGSARRDLRFASTAVVIGVIAQAIVGAFTVILELPPEIVSVHFLLSPMLLVAATFTLHATHSHTSVKLARHAPYRLAIAAIMLLCLLGVIVAGVLTTASGPHSGASGTGQDVDRFGILMTAVTYHARGAYAFFVCILILTWMRVKNHPAARGPAIRDLAVLVALVVVQITLGEVQYRTNLPWGIVLAHVVNAALLWIVAVSIAANSAFPIDKPPTNTSPHAKLPA